MPGLHRHPEMSETGPGQSGFSRSSGWSGWGWGSGNEGLGAGFHLLPQVGRSGAEPSKPRGRGELGKRGGGEARSTSGVGTKPCRCYEPFRGLAPPPGEALCWAAVSPEMPCACARVCARACAR